MEKCKDCGKPMNEGEAKTFTCCDECWDKKYNKDRSKPDIERLKNYLSPIFNYFELLREKPEHTFEEAEICYGVLPKIKKELGLRDLQEVAARQKKELEAYEKFKEAIHQFIQYIGYYHIEHVRINSLMELYRLIRLGIEQHGAEYEKTLRQIGEINGRNGRLNN